MNQREWFVLGSKLVGVYCLVLAVPTFITAISATLVRPDYPQDMARIYKVYSLFAVLTPLLLSIFGFYLIKSGSIVHELAYPNGGNGELHLEGLFTVGVKVYGVYLLGGNMVARLKIISNYIFVSNAPGYVSVAQEVYGIQTNIFPTIGSTCLAMLFILWGQNLARLTIKKAVNHEVS
jgi:hypothetical protein